MARKWQKKAVKITIRLDKRYKQKDGKYPLKLFIARKTTFRLSIGITVLPENWDEKKEEVINIPERKILNALIRQKKSEAELKVLTLQNNGQLKNLSNEELISLIMNNEKKEEQLHLFSLMAEKFLKGKDNASTKRIYDDTIRMMRLYGDYESLTFEEITVSWLNSFNLFLKDSCPAKNTRAIHFRNIRAIFNYAIDEDYISCYPFRKFKIEHEQTEKRSLSLDQMRKLNALPLSEHLQRYRDTFMLVFMLIGINSIDLCQLGEIRNGRIVYKRGKTHKVYDIKVEPEAQEIFDRYKGEEHLLKWYDTVETYRHYANRANLNLHAIGEKIGVKGLTLYWARHTWATFAAEIDIPEDVISQALGHSTTGADVTKVYIRYNHKKVDEANRRVIDYALGKGEFAPIESLNEWE